MGLWTILAGLGRLLAPAIGGLAPAASPKLIIALLTLLLALVAIGAPAGAVWLHLRGERTTAVEAAKVERDAHWQSEITKANKAHEQNLEAARRAADRVGGTPADRAERLRLCQQSPTCRDRAR
jgi:hypothetical protein